MYDGITSLILVVRLVVEGMFEDFINSYVDVNVVDDLGKSGCYLVFGGWVFCYLICFNFGFVFLI